MVRVKAGSGILEIPTAMAELVDLGELIGVVLEPPDERMPQQPLVVLWQEQWPY
jgi:hypothetical protein